MEMLLKAQDKDENEMEHNFSRPLGHAQPSPLLFQVATFAQ
jgi:hypothetical protein